MMKSIKKSSLPRVDRIISYGERPSRATIFNFRYDQFVLIKVSFGAVDSRHIFLVDTMCMGISRSAKDEESLPQTTKLRGLWFDDAVSSVTIYVQILHSINRKPQVSDDVLRLKTELINNGLYKGCSLEISGIECSFDSQYFSPLGDEYYDPIKTKMLW